MRYHSSWRGLRLFLMDIHGLSLLAVRYRTHIFFLIKGVFFSIGESGGVVGWMRGRERGEGREGTHMRRGPREA